MLCYPSYPTICARIPNTQPHGPRNTRRTCRSVEAELHFKGQWGDECNSMLLCITGLAPPLLLSWLYNH